MYKKEKSEVTVNDINIGTTSEKQDILEAINLIRDQDIHPEDFVDMFERIFQGCWVVPKPKQVSEFFDKDQVSLTHEMDTWLFNRKQEIYLECLIKFMPRMEWKAISAFMVNFLKEGGFNMEIVRRIKEQYEWYEKEYDE